MRKFIIVYGFHMILSEYRISNKSTINLIYSIEDIKRNGDHYMLRSRLVGLKRKI